MINQHYKQVSVPLFATVLLIFFVSAAGIGQACGQGVINVSSVNGVDLDSLFDPPTNTVTLVLGVPITNNTSGGMAVSGSSRSWGLTNAAIINGEGRGVHLSDGGTVNNQSNGSIFGGDTALEIDGSPAVDNAGLMIGNSIGIFVNESGVLTNEPNGVIIGGTDGISGFGGPQTTFNAGTIIGSNN